MSIALAYGPSRFGLSFELFPPKTPEGDRALFRHVERLMEFGPAYMTCTYGAGGSTQGKTLEVISRVAREHGIPVATHLTCVGSTTRELLEYVDRAVSQGVKNVVALRGDPPQGQTEFRPVAGGLRYANELVSLLRAERPGLGIAVAGYPEVHQEAPSAEADLENLKRKVDAGADLVITQLFYDNADYFRFRDRCVRAGVRVPIVPGLLPVTNTGQIKRITSLCGARLPKDFSDALEAAGDDDAEQTRVGVEFATRQTQELVDADAPGVHFYVLNKSEATGQVLRSVSLPGSTAERGAAPR